MTTQHTDEMRLGSDPVLEQALLKFTTLYCHPGSAADHDSFIHGWRAATASAEAKYLPVIEKLVEALRFYGDEISYIPTQMREPRTAVHGDNGREAREALSLAAPLLEEK